MSLLSVAGQRGFLAPLLKRAVHRAAGCQLRAALRVTDDGRWRRRSGGSSSSREQLSDPEGSATRSRAWGADQQRPRRADTGSRVSVELKRLVLEDLPAGRERAVRREPAQSFEVLFGVAPCLLALSRGRRTARMLYVKDGEASQRATVVKVCEEAVRRGVPVQRVSKRDLDRMSSGGVHQGLCLQASPLGFLTEDPAAPQRHADTPLWLVLDRIQDPMNLGAILRSAYFLGVDRVASSVRHSCPLTPTVSKASSGVLEVLDVYGYQDLGGLLRAKAARGWQAVGTVGSDWGRSRTRTPVTPCWDFEMRKPTLLLMGGEGGGLSPELLDLCHALLTVPAGREMIPGVESLNVSVAAGILLHSLLASRRAACPPPRTSSKRPNARTTPV